MKKAENLIYRQGAIGAMTDEYEKALKELKLVIGPISDADFFEKEESIEDRFQSVQDILSHIVRSGYAYANYIRTSFVDEISDKDFRIDSVESAFAELDIMFAYNVATFEDKWLLSDEVMMNTIIKTSWTTYDLEAIIEHSIVHILRHRLQIQKLLIKFNKI